MHDSERCVLAVVKLPLPADRACRASANFTALKPQRLRGLRGTTCKKIGEQIKFFVALLNQSEGSVGGPELIPARHCCSPDAPRGSLLLRQERLTAGMMVANRPNSPVFCKSPTTGPDARTTACQTTSSDNSLRVTVTWQRGIVLCDWKKQLNLVLHVLAMAPEQHTRVYENLYF